MNFRLVSDREMTEKNMSVHTRNSCNRMLDSYQSLGSHLRSSQAMQRRQSYPYPNNSIIQDTNLIHQEYQDYPSPNNSIQGINLMLSHQNFPAYSIQGLYHENNILGARTQPMVHLASTSNNNGSLMPRTRHGGVSLLSLPRDPPVDMGSRDIPPSLRSRIGSVGNSLLNNNNLPYYFFGPNNNPLYPIHNMNRSSVFEDCSLMPTHQLNNSLWFKDVNPYPKDDVNNFQGVKHVNVSSPPLILTLTQTSLDRFGSSCKFKDLTRERARKRPLYEVEGADIIGSSSKMPRMSSTPPNFYDKEEPDERKGLLCFKDVEIPFFGSKTMINASEENREDIDLSLHL